MLTLLLMRHGKAEKGAQLPDRDRGLTGRGRRDSSAMGARLARSGPVPQLLLYSTAKRSSQTARRVLDTLPDPITARGLDALYASSSQTILELVRDSGDYSTVLVIGHNPGLEDLASALTGQVVVLTTGAVACIDVQVDSWRELARGDQCRLRWVKHPGDAPSASG